MKSRPGKAHQPDRFASQMTRTDRLSLIFVIVTGLALSLFATYLVHEKQLRSQRLALETKAQNYIAHIDKTINSNIQNLYGLRAFFYASEKVTPAEFDIVTDSILTPHEELKVLEWIPFLNHEQRDKHIHAMRDNGLADYEIKEISQDGRLVSAAERPQYFPVTYINPIRDNRQALGFDLGSNSQRLMALILARDTGRPVATAPVNLVQESGVNVGFLIILPVYDTHELLEEIDLRRKRIRGFVLAAFKIKDLFDQSTSGIRDADLSIDITDITLKGYQYPLLETGRFPASEYPSSYRHIMDVADRKWQFDFVDNSNRQQAPGIKPILTFVTGLSMTAFVAFYILGHIRRRTAIERIVDERTHELSNVKDRIQQILESTGEGIYGLDMNGCATFANRATREITGYSEEELRNKRLHALIHHHYADGSDYPARECIIYQAFVSGRKSTCDTEVFWHKDGHPVPVEYTVTPMRGADGTVSGAVVVFRNISKRLKRQKEITDARSRAETASRAKSRFLAAMSHEIRTPMNGMLGMAQLIADTRLDATQKEYVDTLIQSGKSLLAQINDILDFSRVEAGKTQLETSRFDLHELCHELIRLTDSHARNKNLSLAFNWCEKCPHTVIGDKQRIRKILQNLIDNAIKFTAQGCITLDVDCRSDKQNKTCYLLSVTDTGIGIAEDDLIEIFHPFTQADAGTTRQYGGSGLGLAICKQFAELMQADLTVTSDPGKGSVFTLSLELPRAAELPAPKTNGKGENHMFQGRILLVEDEPMNRQAITAMLESLDLEIVTAENGKQALELFSESGFDLILMDIQMPRMDGYQTTLEIRASEKGATIPIVALTANTLSDNINSYLDNGMNDCLQKPLEINALRKTLANWLPVVETDTGAPTDTDPHTVGYGINMDCINIKHLESMADLMNEMFDELIPTYIKSAEQSLEEIELALEQQDMDALRLICHSLKSSSMNVGAEELSRLAGQLETAAANKRLDEFKKTFPRFRNEYRQVREALGRVKISA